MGGALPYRLEVYCSTFFETSRGWGFWNYVCNRSCHSLRIYPYPMVWPLPRPWSETMVSIPL